MTVFDEDVTSDDHVGSTVLFLEDVFKKGVLKDWIKIDYKGKEAGQVNVEIEFYAENSAGVGGGQGMGGQMNMGGQMPMGMPG
jgi:Ca2+-dependent lipid-binding protein